MKKLGDIPHPAFDEHDEAGTLGDSEEITARDLVQVDAQLKPFGLQLVVFENGSAMNWFVEKL